MTTPIAKPDLAPGSRQAGESIRLRLRRNLFQFFKFGVVGGSGVLVNLAVFNLTLLLWHALRGGTPLAADYTANGAGFVVSVLSNYYLNRRWTFRSSGNVGRELPRFVVVSLIAYGGNLAVFSVCRTQLHIGPNLSQLIAIAFVMPINFVVNKLWSFR